MNGLGILGTILGSALSLRPKRRAGALDFLIGGRGSLINAGTIATVAAAAWGVNELMNRRPPQSTTQAPEIPDAPRGATPAAVRAVPAPRPTPPGEPQLSPDMLRLVRLTIAAVLCDGKLSDNERSRLLADARAANIESIVNRELMNPRSLEEIVVGVPDEAHKRDLYTLAFCVVRADEGVNDRERAWLDQLAEHLELDPSDALSIEKSTAERIDRAAGA
jgi:uncharacterized membrane protein YebE (DUF533 family)